MARPPARSKAIPSAPVFTLDNHGANPVEMPSITKLLNRKKLGMGRSSNTTSFSDVPPSQLPPPHGCPASQNQLAVRKATPRNAERRRPPLPQWDKPTLERATDPFQKGVNRLIKSGAYQVLLLTPAQPMKNAAAQISFTACCAYVTVECEQEQLWRGLSLEPKLISDVWKLIFTRGSFEIPPSTSHHSSPKKDSASFLRKAFGLADNDWLILVRCGAPNNCTGILALVSKTSIFSEIATAFSAPNSRPASSSPKRAA